MKILSNNIPLLLVRNGLILLSCDRYSTFVRIGSGLSFADYVWVREKPWKVWDPRNPPAFLESSKRSHEDKGDVYLEPEELVVVNGDRLKLMLLSA